MYEMYPDAWPAADERRRSEPVSAQPRRRARKEHSVTPAVIALDPDTAPEPRSRVSTS